jgi:hypothetical protein
MKSKILPFNAMVMKRHNASRWIETFAFLHGVFLDQKSECQNWWKTVGELQGTNRDNMSLRPKKLGIAAATMNAMLQ